MDPSLPTDSVVDHDEDGQMQYIRKDFLQPNIDVEGEDCDDDSSSRFFVSEPSTSEADSSENLMRLGAVGGLGAIDGNLLYPNPSASDEDNLLFHLNEQENINESTRHESSDYEPPQRILSIDSPPMPPPEHFLSTKQNIVEVGPDTVVDIAVPPLPPNTINNTAANLSNGYNYSPRISRSRPSSIAYSSDNTSLSSHDTSLSTRWNKKVELDFSSVRSTTVTETVVRKSQEASIEKNIAGKTIQTNHPTTIQYGSHVDPSTRGEIPLEADPENISENVESTAEALPHQAKDNGEISSNSSSSASEAQVQKLGDFLDDLRFNSEGQVKESSVPGSNTSFESSILLRTETDVEDVLRRHRSAGVLLGRRGPKQHQQQTQNAQMLPSSNRNFSANRSLTEYSKDSLAMTLSSDAGEDRNQQQQQDTLVGDTIEMTVPSPTLPLPLPPLHSPTSIGISAVRKQQHDRRRRWSGDSDSKSLSQDQQIAGGHALYYNNDNATSVAGINTTNDRNYLKSTIDNNKTDEWNNQKKEIGLFSQFAIGSRDYDVANRRVRRTRQRSYRQLRTRHLRQESGEDSSSLASSDHSYVNFFQPPSQQSPSQQSPSQPPIDVCYQTTTDGSITPRSFNYNRRSSEKQGHTSDLSDIDDGGHNSTMHIRQQQPPLQIDTDYSVSIPLGNTLYTSSPTHYVPTHTHHRVHSGSPIMNQHFQFEQYQQHLHHQISHTRSHSSAMSMYERPLDDGDHFLHPQKDSLKAKADIEESQPSTDGSDPIYDPSQSYSSTEHDSHKLKMEQQGRDSFAFEDDASYSLSNHSSDDSIEKKRDIHLIHEGTRQDNQGNRHHFIGNDVPKFDRRQFLPQTSTVHDSSSEVSYPTFICPNCNMRQRQFFTVSSAPKQHESEGTLISLLFAVYVVASLYIFGLQEGWGKLDCFYFAVITLTTAGLGDLVPTTDGAKIICSIFIYFGVACIGLLLGSYIAGMLDEKSYREAVANQINACPNCARIKNMQYISQQRRAGFATESEKLSMEHIAEKHAASLRAKNSIERVSEKAQRRDESPQLFQSERPSVSRSMDRGADDISTTPRTPSFESPTIQKQLLGSPMTSQILHRQSHTRHVSMDLRRNNIGSTIDSVRGSSRINFDVNTGRYRNNSADIHIPATVNEVRQSVYNGRKRDKKETENDGGSMSPPSSELPQRDPLNMMNDDLTIDDSDSDIDSLASEVDEIEGRNNSVRNAKYIILTLREALINSLVIIAFGCLGFYLIEGFSFVDSLYFTTVLLTSTGYGDIVPKSDGGKLFATVYLLVGGTILLNNMSMISMIPLELRKRRTEQAVLTQFGDSLDDDALRELATGPLIQRINLGGKDPRGLDECTREMFALAMMIRLGKVTEHDIKLTFAAFRKLDVHNEGILNSKSIIGGMIQKRRRINLNNRSSNGRSDHHSQYSGASQGYGSWIQPAVPSYFDSSFIRRSSTNGSFVPNPNGQSMNHTDHAPLLSMSERAFPQYGMNQYPFAPTFNQ